MRNSDTKTTFAQSMQISAHSSSRTLFVPLYRVLLLSVCPSDYLRVFCWDVQVTDDFVCSDDGRQGPSQFGPVPRAHRVSSTPHPFRLFLPLLRATPSTSNSRQSFHASLSKPSPVIHLFKTSTQHLIDRGAPTKFLFQRMLSNSIILLIFSLQSACLAHLHHHTARKIHGENWYHPPDHSVHHLFGRQSTTNNSTAEVFPKVGSKGEPYDCMSTVVEDGYY